MSEQTRVVHPKEPLLSTDVEGFDSLSELALDMRSSWNPATDQVWRQLDPVLWELAHNPWVVLQTVSREKLQVEAKARVGAISVTPGLDSCPRHSDG